MTLLSVRQFIRLSPCNFVIVSSSVCQYITLSVHHTVSLSLCQFITLPIHYCQFATVSSSLCQLVTVTSSLRQFIILSVCHCQFFTHSMHSTNARDIGQTTLLNYFYVLYFLCYIGFFRFSWEKSHCIWNGTVKKVPLARSLIRSAALVARSHAPPRSASLHSLDHSWKRATVQKNMKNIKT